MDADLAAKLDELRLVRDSLLSGEYIVWRDGEEKWSNLIDSESSPSRVPVPVVHPDSTCSFQVKVVDAPIWLDIELPTGYPKSGRMLASVKVNGVDRREHEKWQAITKALLVDVASEEYPLFMLLSVILPQVHSYKEDVAKAKQEQPNATASSSSGKSNPSGLYHALLSSHHLLSLSKRKFMHAWASELSLRGFAKLYYPGVIYCEGEKESVEEFVSNVKEMQWLNLRVRVVEALPKDMLSKIKDTTLKPAWVEFDKLGDALDYMRKLGREAYMTDAGLGSTGASTVTN